MISAMTRSAAVPVQLLHELAHVAVAAPFAADWEIVVGPTATDTFVEFRDDAPAWGVALAHLAPLLSGLLGAGIAGLVFLAGGLSGPLTAWDLLLHSTLAMAWTLYTKPSRSDVQGAIRALQGADDSGD